MPTPDPNATPDLTGAAANPVTTTSVASVSNAPPATLDPATGQPVPFLTTPVEQSAPQNASQITNVSFDPVLRSADQINNNPLDPYIDVIYNISVALVSWNAAATIRQDTVQGANLNPGDYIIFASTGEAVTNKDYQGDYYNIKSYVFTSFVGHLPQNPMAAISWDAKMKIIQPYGFSFREDIDALAKQLGYPITTPLNFVYRVEVWFSGYKPTGEWVSRIPFSKSEGQSSSSNSIVYFASVTTCEAKVTATGTEYDLSFATISHLATRAEVIVMHHDQHGAIGNVSVGYTTNNTFGDFIQSLVKALHNQVFFDTQGWLNVEYQFLGPDWLFNAKFSADGKIDFSSGVTYNDDSGSYAFSGNNVDIFTLLNHVMNALPLVRALHLREDDPAFTQPGCLWNIRTNLARVDDPNHVVNGFRKYKYQYIIEPVLSFRSRLTEVAQRNIRVSYANQLARANAMRSSGMLVRVYDYFFTANNTEVIDFQFMFKNFYYESYPYESGDNTMSEMTHNQADSNFQQEYSQIQSLFANFNYDTSIDLPSYILQATGSSSDLGSILGIPSSPQGASSGAEPATIHQGLNRTPVLPASQNLGASEAKTQKYLKSKDQYMRFDMVNAQITVRFDPTWLMNPYMAGRDFTAGLSTDQGSSSIFVNTDRVVFIRAHRPNQKNYMNPDFSNTAPKRAPILGGFYQVLTAVNEFKGGRFVQKLNMLKYPHMNYFDSLPGENTSATIQQSDTTQVQSADTSAAAVGDAQDPNTPNPLEAAF